MGRPKFVAAHASTGVYLRAVAAEPLIREVEAELGALRSAPLRLVLLAGLPATGKSAVLHGVAARHGREPLDLSAALATRLEAIPRALRGLRAPELLDGLLPPGDAPAFLDDNELLFLPELSLRPLNVLCTLARHRVVVATWTLPSPEALHALTHQHVLSYALPGHPEHHTEDARHLRVLTTPWPVGPRPR